MARKRVLGELKLPADPQYVLVAKRTAAALGSIMGFDLEGLDELNIAVAQACERAIGDSNRRAYESAAELRLIFRATDSGMEIEVNSLAPAGYQPEPKAPIRRRPAYEPEGYELTLEMIRCFVDEVGYQMDRRTGATRMRLVKYLIDA